MYGSRTDKARGTRMSRSDEAYARYVGKGRLKGRDEQDEQVAIGEQVTAMLDDVEPAMLRDCESEYDRWAIEELHAEALRDHAQWYEDRLNMERDYDLADWEAELLVTDIGPNAKVAYTSLATDFSNQVWEVRMRLEEEDQRERDARYDGAFGGYSNDVFEEDGFIITDGWLPFMRMEELRETFGHNWLGNGFHIIDGNGIRRSK